LNGKKSAQTIQDAHLFTIKKFFRIFELLPREDFEDIIDCLQEKKWIRSCGSQINVLTERGEMIIEEIRLPQYINGWEYHHISTMIWERLSLFIQVISNVSFKETHYIPIQKDKKVHLWLKSVLKQIQVSKDEIGKMLFEELFSCLDEAKDIDPAVLVYRLTGYKRIGLTSMQAAKKSNRNIQDYQLEFLNVLHYLIATVEKEGKRFSLLSLLFQDLNQSDSLTISARKTLELLRLDYSITQIAQIRDLKISTIEDHIVELALNHEDFLIDAYVDKELQRKVLEISSQLSTRKLKQIRTKLETASYFQIRLVLAKMGERR
jgi:uncharacterized protein YpbB